MAGFAQFSFFDRPQPFSKHSLAAYRNFLMAKYETYAGKVTVRSRPYYLIVDPCDACQLRCPTCPTGVDNQNRLDRQSQTPFRMRRSAMSVEMFDAVLDELGDALFVILFYNFGEPLNNKSLPDFVRKATARGIETEVHTHLSLRLTDAYIDDLLQAGLTSLNVSIDGFSQATYQRHRVGGNLALVKENLERFVRARGRLHLSTHIIFNWLTFAFNEHEIPEAAAYSTALGIAFNPREAFINDPEWLPSHRKDQLPWAVPEELRLRPEVDVGWSPELPSPPRERSPSACGWHYGYSVVQPGGQLAPCCAVSQEVHDMGTIEPGRTSFGDIWNGDSYRRARAHFAGDPSEHANATSALCTRCPWPPFIPHLYSLNDARVFGGFHKVMHGADPDLVEAFDQICRLRYGASVTEFCTNPRIAADFLFVGHEDAASTAGFVRFVETHLLTPMAVGADG